MDPLLVELLGVAFRWLVTSVGAYLVAHHVLSPDQENTFRDHALTYLVGHVVIWAPLVSGLVLGIWSKYRSRVKFLTGLQSVPGTTEAQVKAKIENGMGASVKTSAVLLACVLGASGCGLAPAFGGRSTAQLTMPGIVALHGAEVVKALDVIRDTAIDAEAAKLTPTNTARTIVTWHKATLLIIRESPGGWRPTVLASLDELERHLSPADLVIYKPFLDGARVVIKGVIA